MSKLKQFDVFYLLKLSGFVEWFSKLKTGKL